MGGICSRNTESVNNRMNNYTIEPTSATPYNKVIDHKVSNRDPVVNIKHNPTDIKADILMIDSSHCLLKMNGMMLSICGHTIKTIDNGEEALDIIINKFIQTNKLFDVILLNIKLSSNDSGVYVVKRIREFERENNVKHKIIIG
jgi:hypothetical protein